MSDALTRQILENVIADRPKPWQVQLDEICASMETVYLGLGVRSRRLVESRIMAGYSPEAAIYKLEKVFKLVLAGLDVELLPYVYDVDMKHYDAVWEVLVNGQDG